MLALIEAAGWPIWPLIIASVLALAIIFERSYSLRRPRVMPENLLEQTLANLRQNGVTPDLVRALGENSPFGLILASGLRSAGLGRELMKETLEETGRAVAHELDRYLMSLGTIASVGGSPCLAGSRRAGPRPGACGNTCRPGASGRWRLPPGSRFPAGPGCR